MDEDLPRTLAGVPWHTLNQQHRRDYGAAVAEVLTELTSRAVDADRVRRAAEDVLTVLTQFDALRLERSRRGKRPPREG